MIDLTTIQSEIDNFDPEQIKLCPIPLEIYGAEAIGYVVRAEGDLDTLQTSLNFQPETLERARFLSHHLLDMIGEIKGATSEKKTKQAAWEQVYNTGHEYSRYLIDFFEYVFMGNEEIQEKLAKVREGDSIVDTIDDLHVLHAIGTENVEKLLAVNFTEEQLNKAHEFAVELTEQKAQIDSQRYLDSQQIVNRNIVYSLLKHEVDLICAAGRFIHRKDADKRLGYGSKYRRDHTRATAQKARNEGSV